MGRILVAVLLALFVVAGADVRAQSLLWGPTAFEDPAIRSRGMAGVAGPVFWGDSPNDAVNPALLGYRRGFQYDFSRVDQISFEHFTVGAWGAGLALTGEPLGFFGYAHTNLESGRSDRESYALGVNLLEFAAHILRPVAQLRNCHRWGDVSLGYASNRVSVTIDWPREPLRYGTARTRDLGLLVRFTPVHSLDAAVDRRGTLLELSFSHVTLNYDDADLRFRTSASLGHDTRTGVGLHWATGISPGLRARLENGGRGWLAEALTPSLAVGLAYERTNDFFDPARVVSHRVGCEIVLADVLALRSGMYRTVFGSDGGHDWSSDGSVGIGLSVPNAGGFRIDLYRQGGRSATVLVDPSWLARLAAGR